MLTNMTTQVSSPCVRTADTKQTYKDANMHHVLEATFQKCKIYALPWQGTSYFNA